MENQGYEEDQSRAAAEQAILESRRDQQPREDTIDVIDDDSVVARTTPHLEGHVYEDIVPGVGTDAGTDAGADTGTDACEFSERTSCLDESRDPREIGNHQSIDFVKQAWINEPSSSPAIDRLFQQSLALFSSTRISTNHDSVTTLSGATSRTSEDEPEKGFRKSRELPAPPLSEDVSENVSSSSRANEDSSRDASVTQSNRRPNRRRKKKDCKHCRSKLVDAGSCEKLDNLISYKDMFLKENGDNHRDKNPDTSILLFRESLLRPQNIKVYPIVRRTSLRDIDAKRGSLATLPASEYGVHTKNAAGFLLNTETDRMFGPVVENVQNKILGVSGNGTDMRINSIYSQDRWYGKESQIFYTDVKDQNPFQVSYGRIQASSRLLFLSLSFLSIIIKFIDR